MKPVRYGLNQGLALAQRRSGGTQCESAPGNWPSRGSCVERHPMPPQEMAASSSHRLTPISPPLLWTIRRMGRSFRRRSRLQLSSGMTNRMPPRRGRSMCPSATARRRFTSNPQERALASVRSTPAASPRAMNCPRSRRGKPLRIPGFRQQRPGRRSSCTQKNMQPPFTITGVQTGHSGCSRLSRHRDHGDLQGSGECADLLSRRAIDSVQGGKGGHPAAGQTGSASPGLAPARYRPTHQPFAAHRHAHLRQLPFILTRRKDVRNGYRRPCKRQGALCTRFHQAADVSAKSGRHLLEFHQGQHGFTVQNRLHVPGVA